MSARASISLALIVALGASLLFHAAALFVPNLEIGAETEPPRLLAELRAPAPPPVIPSPPKQTPKFAPKPTPKVAPVKPVPPVAPMPPPAEPATVASAPTSSDAQNSVRVPASPVFIPPEATATPVAPALSGRGSIRYAVYRGVEGFEVGRAVHDWEFSHAQYRITVSTETTGLAAFFKPVRLEYESRGKITAKGLQPETFVARKNGVQPGDRADFDWASGVVRLSRDGRSYPLNPGVQDFASFYYHLLFLPQLAGPVPMGVVTARKLELYWFSPLGEERIDTPLGRLRTLHVQVQTDSRIDLWLALDRQRLPVKIRSTDKNGDAFEQIAVEIGSPGSP